MGSKPEHKLASLQKAWLPDCPLGQWMAEPLELSIFLARHHIPASKKPHSPSNLSQCWARPGFVVFCSKAGWLICHLRHGGPVPQPATSQLSLAEEWVVRTLPRPRDKDLDFSFTCWHSETSPGSLGSVAVWELLLSECITLPGRGGWHTGTPGTGHCLPSETLLLSQVPLWWHQAESQDIPISHSWVTAPDLPACSAAPVATKESISQRLLFHATTSGREGEALGRQLLQIWRPCVLLHRGTLCA